MAINITGTEVNADILQAMVQGVPVNKHTALEIPMISRCISMIADAVAALPIKLYCKVGDGVEEVKDDRRVVILNGDTGDTLNADYMRQVMVRDYLLYGNAYAYIETSGGKADKLFYVDAELVGRELTAIDPIHKQYRYIINGQQYMPYRLLKILRNSDGYGCGTGIIEENPELIGAAYGLLQYHKKMILTGGAKRGILRTQKLNKDVLADVKAKWAALWAGKSDQDTMMVLNSSDMDFKELSTSSVDMQVNQTQETLDKEIMKLFGTADGLLSEDTVKNAVMPVIDAIEAALDSDLLLEREKGEYYFAFDTRELTRGDITQRFNAYATALSRNFMQLDEVRAMEDLPPLGINFVKLGLNDVLLDPKTGQIYTPNTNQYATMGESAEIPLTSEGNGDKIEERAKGKGGNPNHLPAGSSKGGQFTFSFGHNVRLLPKEYGKITREIAKDHQRRGYKNGEPHYIESVFNDVQKFYAFEVIDMGNYRFMYAYVTQSKNRRQCNRKYVEEVKRGIDLWNSV